MTFVLDASAVLAFLNGEAGAEEAAARFPGSAMSVVNAIEVGSKLMDRGMTNEAAWEAIELLDVTLVDVDAGLAASATALRKNTRAKGLSLADRVCLALAIREKLPAVTTDRLWASLDIGCPIEVIR
ncbi:type II toxin-antitoxin system VapC family toxin [Chelativorans sp.]|uniref:type II toxin-antitoxin system VapC family toxin n=1 Tax=Chelativorans sp. TaxID=2203393 RepID=UPI002812635B|nr:type II toxin-antitoxin system VapC family toxin [Chelativorans sp.]